MVTHMVSRWAGSLFIFCIGLTVGVYCASYDNVLNAEALDEREVSSERSQLYERHLLTNTLPSLEARIERLDALGQLLATSYGLDGAEFGFSEQDSTDGFGHQTETLQCIGNRLSNTETHLQLLKRSLDDTHRQKKNIPSGAPIKKGVITSGFGKRVNPFTKRREIHLGMDFSSRRKNAEIYAVASGLVTISKEAPYYGRLVEIDHGNGYKTRYAHNQVNLVQKGDIVRRGEVVALLGNSGRSTAPHVHFEVLKKKRPVNPSKYVRAR